jgi:hypothetical protein
MNDWIEAGNTMFVLLSGMGDWFIVHEAGKGRSNVAASTLPFLGGLNLTQSAGQLVEPCAQSQDARHLLSSIAGDFFYERLIEAKDMEPLLRVSAESTPARSQIVAGFRRHGKGMIIYLPSIKNMHLSLISKLLALPAALALISPPIPDWTNRFALPQEAAARKKIAMAQSSIVELQTQIANQEAEIDQLQPLKQLLWAYG